MAPHSKPLKETQPELARQLAREEARLHSAHAAERTAASRGLLWLGLALLVVIALMAGRDRIFYTGWWRQW